MGFTDLHEEVLDAREVWDDAQEQSIKQNKSKLPVDPGEPIDVIREQYTSALESFQSWRHDGRRVDRFRTVLQKNSDIISQVAEMITESSSQVNFPLSVPLDISCKSTIIELK